MKFKKSIAWLMALTMSFAGTGGLSTLSDTTITVDAASTGSRILVDLNKNDGRKASYTRNANNWIVSSDSNATFAVNGVTMTLNASGGSIRMENNKKLQKMSGDYSPLTMDGATVDASSGGILTLKISGLSDGTHSIKTYHSATGNESVSGISVSASGGTSQNGISCPNQVTAPDDAGIGYVTFSGTSTTITIKAQSGNAWLNGFEIDGGDPIKGVHHISPTDQNRHHPVADGLSWKAGSGAKSHDVYIGTSYDNVFNATTKSSEYKGNQTGTTYALDDTYQSINTYYWRVDTIDGSGNVIKGSVNAFNVARLAFPTAEGYGRFARGGQGGVVVHVTSLEDDVNKEGTLRYALCNEKWETTDWVGVPRIVVFDVGGVIALKDTLCISDNAGSVYIAGQTAPGDGITLINYDFGAMGSEDVIIRDIRTRVGDMNGSSHGGMGLSSCNNTIIDHCSISWATDEGFSSRNAQNITFQWNIIGESLHDSVHYLDSDRTQTECHAFAASIGGYTGSYHHNLLINNTGRNWSLAGALEQDGKTYGSQADIRNNVVYNWMDRTTDGGVRRLNFVNNFYKAGHVSNTGLHVVSTDGNEIGSDDMQMMYVSGNIMTALDGSYVLKASDNAWDKGKAVSGTKNSVTAADVRSDTPFFESHVETESAEDAYKSVIAGVGAGGTSEAGWDYIDARYIKEVTNTTYTYEGSKQHLKGIIDSQEDVGGYPNSSNFAHSNDGVCNAANDTDRDGMPNVWEEAHGLNPNDASDGAINSLSPDGYTNVEMFLNELMGDPMNYGTPPVTGKPGAVIDTAYKYTITNKNSGMQLEVASAEAANGANVQQGTSGAIGWTFEDAGDGYYRIFSEVGDGKTFLLDVDYGKTDNGTNIGIWGDTAADAQLFKMVDNGDGTYNICTKGTKDESCLGVAAGSKDEGANVVQWACNGSDDQKWILEIKLDPITGSLIQELQPKDADLYNYWAIDTDLAEGDIVFGDRTGDKLVTYKDIPEALVGAEYVVTPCDAKNLTTDIADLTAAEDITLYVGLDARTVQNYGVPAWMSSWNDTGMTVTNSKDVNFSLYSLDLFRGETITLGQNGGSSGCVFYTIFAMKQREIIDQPQAVPYDVTCDGRINIFDLVSLKSFLLGTSAFSDQEFVNADCNSDGEVTVVDVVALQKKLLGLK